MSKRRVIMSNYEAVDHRVPKFRKLVAGVPEPDQPKADISIAGPGSPPDLPAGYRFDGVEEVATDGTEFVGVAYNLADDPTARELHTCWIQCTDGHIRIFLGSRMVSFKIEG